MGSAVEHDFLTLLSELARRIRSHGDHSARHHWMIRAQLMIVRRLERQPGLSENELAAVVGVTPITVATSDACRSFRASRQQVLPSRAR
jgi:MarR family transcriptional regulator, transcriptional regulator for hemolysin